MSNLQVTEVPVFDQDVERFLAFLAADTKGPLIAPEAFSRIFNFDTQSLATAARVHRDTVVHSLESEDVQHFLRESVRVVLAAVDVSWSIEKAILWYKNHPVSTFDYKVPQQLVSDGAADDLIHYLQSLKVGFLG